MDRIDKEKFVQIVLAEFPQLSEEFAEYKDLLHLQMAAFSHLTQNAIDKNDLETLEKCYELAAEILAKANPDVEKTRFSFHF